MSIGEGGRLSASSSGVGSIGTVEGSSSQSKILSGRVLHRENTTTSRPCEETCGFCQLECPNCSSYAALSVQRIDGKIQQVWTIVNKSSASTNYNINEEKNLDKNSEGESKATERHGYTQNTYTSLGNVSTLCSRRAVHLTPCKDCVKYDASAPPLSRPQSSDSGLFDLSEGKPVPFDRLLSIETIAKYSNAFSQARTNRVSPSSQSKMSEIKDESAENTPGVPAENDTGVPAENDTGIPAEDESETKVLPLNEEGSSPEQDSSSGSDAQVSELKSATDETDDDNAKEGSQKSPSGERVTNPFEEGYEDPIVVTKEHSANKEDGPNPFDEDDTNPFNTSSPTSSANSSSSESRTNSKKKSSSPSTRPSSSILDVRKLLHADKVFPINLDGQTKVSESGNEANNSQYDPEALGRQPSIVSSTGPTVFSKSALFLKQMLIGAAVIILVGVVVMFIASLGKSMMR